MCKEKEITLGNLENEEFPYYNEAALERFVDKNYKLILGYCRWLFPEMSYEDLQDLMQEGFLYLLRIVKRGIKKKDAPVGLWFHKHFREHGGKKFAKDIRAERERVPFHIAHTDTQEQGEHGLDEEQGIIPESSDWLPDEVTREIMLHERFQHCLKRLAEDFRYAVELMAKGMQKVEAAKILDISVSLLIYRLKKAQPSLRICLEGYL